MKYTVRNKDGSKSAVMFTKEAANLHAKQINGYVKTKRDGINPFKEEL